MKRSAPRCHATARRTERGGPLIEFALLLPILLALAFGATELGRAIYTYNALDKTVRDAARHLSQHGPGDTQIQGEATCLAVYGNTDCSGDAVAPGLSTSMVVLCDAISCPSTHLSQATGVGVINLVSASIQGYEFFSAVTYVIPDLDFNNITVMMRAQL
ncbi:TadE/TadG family type IV pilus assembly protein [Ideonella sp.]|uniref:TadE/TadG family type IV pilus assembly protein n=1 Tax=Ideonella sp. TaxID=1929293 RepID=UPI002B46FF28|nr:TadE/TadG family type IV pilus assembly protein [Ideonella sp.]HJV69443.1 TadE/TadG family type IV pilus assembly protein [Ideonella sp.]